MLKRFWRWLRRLKPLYWLRCHTITQYHLVDCRNPHYRWGWCDRSELIFYAAFAILVDFIEEEKAFNSCVDWDYDEHHRKVRRELLELYEWWKFRRDDEHAEAMLLFERVHGEDEARGGMLSDACMKPLPNGNLLWDPPSKDHPLLREWLDRHNALDKKDDEQLMRLIKLRGYMWT